MQVELKSEAVVAYSDIREGECFLFRGDFYLKTSQTQDGNAANLKNGKIHDFLQTATVSPINLKVVQI